VVTNVSRRAGQAGRHEVDDLVQETFLKMFADDFAALRAFDFRDDEALSRFVRVIAANVARDHIKFHAADRRDYRKAVQLDDERTLQTSTVNEDRIIRQIAIAEVFNHVEEATTPERAQRDRKIFSLYYRFGWSAPLIAAIPEFGLTTKGVESVLARLNSALRSYVQSQTLNVGEKAKSKECR
jgi:RNA polymerase sigma factor (sigma-70 family)